MSWTEIRVPATSANLGPGFDALGMALSIYPVSYTHLIAGLRIADDFGCSLIGVQYQQGLKDLAPASDPVSYTHLVEPRESGAAAQSDSIGSG